jgi:glycosyltransferase involved in cell wall biosynthesis
LAPEKNLDYQAHALAAFMERQINSHFIVAGQGPSAETLQQILGEAGVAARTHFLGTVEGTKLADVYAAMDVFAFCSRSETQGLVLAEAMAAGVPVVALDAP